jgi:hypothetical protein
MRRRHAVRYVSALGIAACHGGGPAGCHGGGHGHPDAIEPDAPSDAADDASMIDAPIDSPPDAPIDAPPTYGVSAVATVDGYSEVRQGSSAFFGLDFTAHLVVTGTFLADVDNVMVGPLSCAITSTAASEVRCDLDVPHGYPPGPLTVTVHSPSNGTATSPNPITITFVTAGPDAAPGSGNGTRQSPFNLCDIGSVMFNSYTYSGDTIDVLPGTHTCTGFVGVDNGVDIRGAGVGVTIVGPGFQGFDGGYAIVGDPNGVTHVTGISFVDPAGPAVRLDDCCGGNPGLVVDGIAVTGGTAGAILVAYQQIPPPLHAIDIKNVSYDGAGIALDLPSSQGQLSNITAKNCDTAIHGEWQGTIGIDHLTVDSCARGILLTQGPQQAPSDPARAAINVDIADIHAQEVGARIERGHLGIGNATIVSNGPDGILLLDGTLSLTGSQLAANDTALDVTSFGDTSANVSLDGDMLAGGRVGIEFASTGDAGRLVVRNSRVQGGDNGLIWDMGTLNNSIDIGGGNDLIGGVFAYVDGYDHPFTTVNAVGTTLNGHSYAGQLLVGPAQLAPDYNIILSGATQF